MCDIFSLNGVSPDRNMSSCYSSVLVICVESLNGCCLNGQVVIKCAQCPYHYSIQLHFNTICLPNGTFGHVVM